MPFKNRQFAKKVAALPCEWCGWQAGPRHATRIIDEISGSQNWNAVSLCPNCAAMFDDKIRPKLYKALSEYGTTNLPKSWQRSNKIS